MILNTATVLIKFSNERISYIILYYDLHTYFIKRIGELITN